MPALIISAVMCTPQALLQLKLYLNYGITKWFKFSIIYYFFLNHKQKISPGCVYFFVELLKVKISVPLFQKPYKFEKLYLWRSLFDAAELFVQGRANYLIDVYVSLSLLMDFLLNWQFSSNKGKPNIMLSLQTVGED